MIGLAGFGAFAAVALIGSRSEPGLWAGATYLLTCGLLGLAVLGAVWGRGKRRAVWLGAALFGAGYLALALGGYPDPDAWPKSTAAHLVHAVCDRLPPLPRGAPVPPDDIAARNARIRRTLEQPIPIRFPQETPLEDVLKSIKDATKGPDDTGIPIYVDPVGLQAAERTMTSPVTLDLEGVPLKTTLRLMLRQLGLAYAVRSGVLVISEADSIGLANDDPAVLVGHCLVAVLAAVVGGVASALIFERSGGRGAAG
jgi:hypothetical protein